MRQSCGMVYITVMDGFVAPDDVVAFGSHGGYFIRTMDSLARIKILSPELASQIAAGEVVERPASVVKELVENALDAKSSLIEVEVSLKRRRIRIKDNGDGIAAGEIELAVARHGTSKIGSLDDIFGIGTYGFRGEALPSIASVSRLTLSSCRRGEKTGRMIVVEGGETLKVQDAPALQGTEVLVENLFYNTPARRKFSRSEATEMGHITSRVVQAALAAPMVRFNFIKDGKRVMELPPAATLLERVRQVFGADYADNLVEINYADFDMKVNGLAGKPHFHRASAIDQYFFINRRPVKDALVRSAVLRAFDDLVPRGRKPVVFLNLELPVAVVDVNVHPAKAEVRLADPSKVADAIVRGIRKAFGKSSSASPVVPVARQDARNFRPFPTPPGEGVPPENREAFARAFELWRPPAAVPMEQLKLHSAHGRLSQSAVAVGQVFKTFIMFEEGERLVIMDQHTVHERVLFERLMKRYLSSSIERQGLLVPVTVSADPKKSDMLRSHIKTFSSLGWELEEFGQSDFIIRQVPAVLVGKDYRQIALDIAETLGSNRDEDFKDVLADCISRIACRAAIKAGDELGLGEMRDLAQELASAELPYTCPHGRPIAFTIPKEELKKYFSR